MGAVARVAAGGDRLNQGRRDHEQKPPRKRFGKKILDHPSVPEPQVPRRRPSVADGGGARAKRAGSSKMESEQVKRFGGAERQPPPPLLLRPGP